MGLRLNGQPRVLGVVCFPGVRNLCELPFAKFVGVSQVLANQLSRGMYQ